MAIAAAKPHELRPQAFAIHKSAASA